MRSFQVIIFLIIFVLGCFMRALNFGWYMFFLLIPEVIFRLFYLVGGIVFVLRGPRKSSSFALQASYLLASFFTYDGGDLSTYAFAGLWQNPPEFVGQVILLFYVFFVVLTLVLLIRGLVKKKPHTKRSN